MDNLTTKEEVQILNAAKLAGTDAPEILDTKRAHDFVHGKLNAEKSHRRTFFTSPVTYMAFAVAACAVAALIIFNPNSDSSLEIMQQDQVHAAADSLDSEKDSLEVKTPETYELTTIDE